MKDVLLYILSHIVSYPDALTIDEASNDSRTLFTIHVHAEDMGHIIGKQGRIIRSIRDIMKLMAAKNNTYVDIAIAEESTRP